MITSCGSLLAVSAPRSGVEETGSDESTLGDPIKLLGVLSYTGN